MNFEQTPEFSKELKKFGKKWRRIEADLSVLMTALSTIYGGAKGIPAEHIRQTFFATRKAAVLQLIAQDGEVVKVRLDSSDLNGDMLRVTYIRSGKSILLVELYAKNDKAREDSARIQRYLKQGQ